MAEIKTEVCLASKNKPVKRLATSPAVRRKNARYTPFNYIITNYWHHVQLDADCWFKMIRVDGITQEEYDELWGMHPPEKLRMNIAGKSIECPRWSSSYLRSYTYSNSEHSVASEMPKVVARLLEFARESNPLLNQCLINWYPTDGAIGKHSDDVKQLVPDSEIWSFSFGCTKKFIIEPKQKDGEKHRHITTVENNCLVIMGGKCQTNFVHYVPRTETTETRINVTFRCFKD